MSSKTTRGGRKIEGNGGQMAGTESMLIYLRKDSQDICHDYSSGEVTEGARERKNGWDICSSISWGVL